MKGTFSRWSIDWVGGRAWFLLMGGFALLLIQAWLMTSDGAGGGPLQVNRGESTLYSLSMSPLGALGSMRAALLTNVALLAIAGVMAARVLQRRWGSSAPLVMLVYVFGSVVFARSLIAEPQILLLTSTVLAFVSISRAERPLAHDTPEIYHEPNLLPRVILRWFFAGLLLGIPAVHDPIYLCLFLPALASLPRSNKGWAAGSFVVGALVLAGLLFAATDLRGSDDGSISDRHAEVSSASHQAEPSGESPGSILEGLGRRLQRHESLQRLSVLPDWELLGWNGLYFLVGRNLGILPYFIPLLLILAGWGTSWRETVLVGTVVLAAILALWLHPFNFSGEAGGLGNGRFLPLYGALWLLPTKRVRPVGIFAVTILAAIFLWPVWASPQRATHRSIGTAWYAAEIPFRFLPYEMSQRGLPQFGSLRRQGLLVRCLTPSIEYSEAKDRLVLFGGRWGEILISSEVEFGSVVLDFDKSASTELEVSGGEVTGTIFRPDGRVAFQIEVEQPHASYPEPDSGRSSYHYRLRLRMEGSETAVFSVKGVNIEEKSGFTSR